MVDNIILGRVLLYWLLFVIFSQLYRPGTIYSFAVAYSFEIVRYLRVRYGGIWHFFLCPIYVPEAANIGYFEWLNTISVIIALQNLLN